MTKRYVVVVAIFISLGSIQTVLLSIAALGLAKGYSQIVDIDFQKTFAHTTRMSSVRMLLEKAVQNDMISHQMDVKAAYLNVPTDCDIHVYMKQPKGFKMQGTNGEK